MKVARNTPEQLILADTPWLIGIMLVCFILAFAGAGLGMLSQGGSLVWPGLLSVLAGGGIGAAAFCVFVRRVQVIFDRRGGSIVIRHLSVFGYQEVEHRLADLSHAEVESMTSRRQGRTRTLYRPVLVLDAGLTPGRHPVVQAFTSGRGPQRLSDAINAWLPAEYPAKG